MGQLFFLYGLLTNVAISVGFFVLISKELYPNSETNLACIIVGTLAAVVSGNFLVGF